MKQGAVVSEDGVYRYSLWRNWRPGPSVMFIGLNPSTADAEVNDPTIRRCMGFARRLHFGTLYMLNVYGFRTTHPEKLKGVVDPVGPDNDQAIIGHAGLANTIICGWGSYPGTEERALEVVTLLRDHKLFYLELNQDGHPKHPLYISYSKKPKVFKEAGE